MLNRNAKLWVKALRSGKYKQGKEALRRDNKFCCLGVACDLYSKTKNKLEIEKNEGVYLYDGWSATLPTRVMQWIGLTTPDGEISNEMTLASLNDKGSTFKQIAKIIESKSKKLFVPGMQKVK